MSGLLRVVVHGPLGGPLNMAIDDVLLASASTAFPVTLRLYAWLRPTVSIGYAQRWREGFDPVVARRHGIGLVRRSTGGRAVLHAGELTYSVAGPATDGPFATGIHETYRVISSGIREGLRALGVDSSLERSRGRREGAAEPGACFGSRALYELVADGRKLLGSAQRRTQTRVLQHGSLPLAAPDPTLWEVLGPSGPAAVSTTVGLYEILRPSPSRRALVAALAAGLGGEIGLRPVFRGLDPSERRAAVRGAARYADPEFTKRV